MQKIDILAFIVESFDSDYLKEDILSFSSDSLIVMFNAQKVWISYKPLWCDVKTDSPLFFKSYNPKWGYRLFPILFLIYCFRAGKILFSVCFRYRVGTILIHNTYIAVIGGIIRRFGMARRMIYYAGDWLAGSKTKIGGWSGVGNNIIFPLSDYLACKFSDITLNCTQAISKSRRDFWGMVVPAEEHSFRNKLQVKGEILSPNKKRTKIAFIGSIREDSGLDLCVKSLKSIRQYFNAGLKIIGSPNRQTAFIKRLVQEQGIGEFVEFPGFIQRGDFKKELSDCFCGISLQTGRENYSSKTLPAKIYDCLQYLLPVVITLNATSTTEEIEKNKLGVIVKPDVIEITKNIIKIYKEQTQYRKNIRAYIDKLPDENMSQYFLTAKI